jgi:hypothetical protein
VQIRSNLMPLLAIQAIRVGQVVMPSAAHGTVTVAGVVSCWVVRSDQDRAGSSIASSNRWR